MTTVTQIFAPLQKVYLKAGTPLSFLAQTFPEGVPVSRHLTQIAGSDCYDFNPATLLDVTILLQLGVAITSEAYPQELIPGFLEYGKILIPESWVAEVWK